MNVMNVTNVMNVMNVTNVTNVMSVTRNNQSPTRLEYGVKGGRSSKLTTEFTVFTECSRRGHGEVISYSILHLHSPFSIFHFPFSNSTAFPAFPASTNFTKKIAFLQNIPYLCHR